MVIPIRSLICFVVTFPTVKRENKLLTRRKNGASQMLHTTYSDNFENPPGLTDGLTLPTKTAQKQRKQQFRTESELAAALRRGKPLNQLKKRKSATLSFILKRR